MIDELRDVRMKGSRKKKESFGRMKWRAEDREGLRVFLCRGPAGRQKTNYGFFLKLQQANFVNSNTLNIIMHSHISSSSFEHL
jgi:hypothetical protein